VISTRLSTIIRPRCRLGLSLRLSFFTTVGALEGLVVSLDRAIVALEVLFKKGRLRPVRRRRFYTRSRRGPSANGEIMISGFWWTRVFCQTKRFLDRHMLDVSPCEVRQMVLRQT